MSLVDAGGPPVAVDTASATPHESRLLEGLFDFMFNHFTLDCIIGDKTRDSGALHDQVACMWSDFVAPYWSNYRPENATQDRWRLPRDRR